MRPTAYSWMRYVLLGSSDLIKDPVRDWQANGEESLSK